MNRIPIVIDCDTGTDDAVALVAALHAPQFDLRAITTVDGNVALKYTSQNTLNLAHYLGFDTPVALGAPGPLMGVVKHSESQTHGDTGMGSVALPLAQADFSAKNAVETIIEQARAFPGELVLIPIGPATNIALALKAYPELRTLIKQIVFMGGAMVGGNITTTAEFNAWADPEALSIMLNSGILCRMIGLDVTLRAVLGREDIDFYRGLGTRAGQVVADLLAFMLERFGRGGEDVLMHDALAVASVADPAIVRTVRYYVDCECQGRYTRGHTYVAKNEVFFRKGERQELCDVALELDLPRFKAWLRDVISLSRQKEGLG